MRISDGDILDEILEQITKQKTVAPRDIAVSLTNARGAEGDDWRKILPRIKKIGTAMAIAGKIVFWRKGKVVSPNGVRGIYRFAAPSVGEVQQQSSE